MNIWLSLFDMITEIISWYAEKKKKKRAKEEGMTQDLWRKQEKEEKEDQENEDGEEDKDEKSEWQLV